MSKILKAIAFSLASLTLIGGSTFPVQAQQYDPYFEQGQRIDRDADEYYRSRETEQQTYSPPPRVDRRTQRAGSILTNCMFFNRDCDKLNDPL